MQENKVNTSYIIKRNKSSIIDLMTVITYDQLTYAKHIRAYKVLYNVETVSYHYNHMFAYCKNVLIILIIEYLYKKDTLKLDFQKKDTNISF